MAYSSACAQVLDMYLETVNLGHATDMSEAFSMGEIQMYKAMLLLESGDLKATQAHLKARRSVIRDRFAALEMQGDVHLRLGEHSEAEAVYRCASFVARGFLSPR